MTTLRKRTLALAIASLLLLVGCNPQAPEASAPAQSAVNGQTDAVATIGDVTVRSSVIQTSMLPEEVARQYGVERSPKTLLLLVASRKGDAAVATSLPATVGATVTDLRGGVQDIAIRQVQADSFTDYVGTLTTTLPDTLRFDVTVRIDGIAPVHLRFQRELYPQ
ncbi:MAG: hypothetical protein JWL98_757 [Xanthomonadaceae bacterium]|nr:hypothetical protein [Xanthomonadaceae bacterium]